jgi:hypothetical protein
MLSWFRQIDDAETPAEVVGVARDYLATWTPAELARLPRACRPGRVKNAQDIEELHVALVEEYRDSRLAGEELSELQQMTSFIVRASIRLARLAGGNDPGSIPPASPPSRSAAGSKR